MELTNILAGTSSPIEKSSSKKHKRKVSDELWKNSKRKPGDDEFLETSSSDSTSRSTPLSHDTVSEIPTPNSALGFHSDLDFPNIDPSDLIETTEKGNTEFDGVDDLGDVEEMLANSGRYQVTFTLNFDFFFTILTIFNFFLYLPGITSRKNKEKNHHYPSLRT